MKSIEKLRAYAKVSWSPWSEAHDHLSNMLDDVQQEHAKLMREAIDKAHADGERSAIKQVRSASEDYRRGYNEAMDETEDIRGFCERLEGAAKERDEIEVFGVAYMPLPVDADGVLIRLGDVMECFGVWEGNSPFEVRAMWLGEGGWELYDRLGDRCHPSITRHHEPTVEDVLREFARDFDAWRDYSGPVNEAPKNPVADYAARLRLAGDAE